MSAEQLLELAAERGLTTFTAGDAAAVICARGSAAADFVAGAGALIDLASAFGLDLTLERAFRRMDAAGGDYQTAAQRIIEPVRQRRQQAFSCEWTRAERALYAGDAKARHAVFVGHLAGGSLGWQTSMLLRAAEDAGLRRPGADEYRRDLVCAVGGEIERRYPVRREAEWQVIGEDTQAHAELVRAEIRRERQAREIVLGRRPELAQRIDALSSTCLRHDVERITRKIRKRLAARAEEGWVADPERYAREVIAEALEAASAAS